jgi:molecular chaperone GrpE
MDKFRKFANESLIKEILAVVDNLERAVNSANDDEWENSDLTQGVALSIKDLEKMVHRGLVGILRFYSFFPGNFHQMCINNNGKTHLRRYFPYAIFIIRIY